MKRKTLAAFGLLMIGLLFMTAVLAAFTAEPLGLAIIVLVLAAMLLTPRGLSRLRSMTGAAGVASDTITNIRSLKYTHTAALTAGDILLVGGWVLQAMNSTLANAENVFIYQGKMTWPKEASLAIAARDMVYWDNTNSVVTKTAVGNTPIGFCTDAALAADTTVTFQLIPPRRVDTYAERKLRAVVGLSDVAATLTAAQLTNSGIFTITPSTARALTLDTAANIVGALPGAVAGMTFDFSVVCLAAYAATLGTASGLTLVGSMAVNNQSATFTALVTNAAPGSEAVTIYRI